MNAPPAASLKIGQYWHGDEVPAYLSPHLASFRELNPEFEHRVFSEADTERLIAERFGARELAAFRACAVPSMQSDYFRYCFLLAHGGVYADADYRCVRPLRPLLDGPEQGRIFLSPTPHELGGRPARRVWSGFLAFREPGHPFMRVALDIATANLEARIASRVWPDGGAARAAIWLTVGPGIPSAMRFIHEWGSFDAFLEAIRGTPLEPFGPLYCEAIGDQSRVVAAFEGVRAHPHESMLEWVDDVPVTDLPYKDGDLHWHNVEGAIFR